jgi:glucosamine-phosphate N-acetyltransferase
MSTSTTSDTSSTEDLFPATLLPSTDSSSSSNNDNTPLSTRKPFSLPPGYTIRPLRRSDYSTGMLDVLRVLTTVGDIDEKAWLARFDYMLRSAPGTYYILVVCDEARRVVGTGGVVVERKL